MTTNPFQTAPPAQPFQAAPAPQQNGQPFQAAQGGPGSLPFTAATTPPSIYPKMTQLSGILVLVTPTRFEQNVPSAKYRNPDGSPAVQDRMTCDVECVDVVPAGFDTSSFPGMYISGSRMIQQLHGQLNTGRPLLGRVELFKPNEAPGQGNPWGFAEPSPQDVERAKAWYQGVRPVPSPSQQQAAQQQAAQNGQQWGQPQQQAPAWPIGNQQQYAQQAPAPAPQQWQQPAPQQYAPQNGQQPQAPAAQGGYAQQFAPQPQDGQAPPANPWSQNGQPLPAAVPGANPFAQQ